MFFKKNTHTQKILFSLKYKNRAELGRYFGRRIGKELMMNKKAKSIDMIVPVPLHPKKAFIRGYNQSQMIAEGISSEMGIKMQTDLIRRRTHSSSQTGKSRFERWDNVKGSFEMKTISNKTKHIAIIDDVITTGSTVENIVSVIHEKHPEINVSVVTLAIA
jgi:ComF family protein